MRLIPTLIALVMFSIIISSSAFSYEIDWYSTQPSGTSNPAVSYLPSMYTDADSCTMYIQPYSSFDTNGTSYTATASYMCPEDIIVGTSDLTIFSNVSGLTFGTIPCSTKNDGAYESKSSISWGGTSGFGTHSTRYFCSGSNDYMTFYVNSTEDSRNQYFNAYAWYINFNPATPPFQALSTTLSTAVSKLTSGNFAPDQETEVTTADGVSVTTANTCNIHKYDYLVFNSSQTGLVNISAGLPSVKADNTISESKAWLYKIDEGVTSEICSSLPCQVNLSLQTDTIYVLLLGYNINKDGLGFPNINCQYYYSNFNFSVNIVEPDWSCGAWSECVNNSRWRLCTDLSGKVPDRIETSSCFSAPYVSLNLGFEESYPIDVYKCDKYWWLVACTDVIVNRSVEYPVNWSVINMQLRFDFANVVSDTSTEGTRSLKLWYIPPTTLPFYGTPYYCDYSLEGAYPQIYRGVNNSNFVEYNLTFPTPYMTISYDVKKCVEPVVQYETWLGVCGKLCYGNCTAEPRGKYLFRLRDTNTSSDVLTYYADADLEWKSNTLDISNLGLDTTHTYNLIFSVNPYDIYDANAHCIYLDNVNINVLTAPLIDCDTTPYCEDFDLITPVEVGGACIFERDEFSPACVPDAISDAVDNCSTFCYGNDYYSGTLDEGDCLWTIIEDFDDCIEEAEDLTIYDPIPIIANLTNQTQLEEAGLDWTLNFVSPIFLYLLISLVISVGLTYVLRENDKAGLFGLVAFLVLMAVGSLPQIGLFPIWLLIVLIVIAGLLFAKTMIGLTRGG